ncbi:alpha/beta fold hydrolase [Burkholderia sp. Ac-20353]|uniref:alpha/beta fold hydrolase n=1 Tax=Burkholderia sp. Ac-20353 TaxID=2703894 RepID=UPI00197C12EA|nr:alpha/beta fold hydrolase [Burkholderia sp. Ac-20353]MBN3789076.1 alpha/beta hydrolase [Burkholderia sp. Ac-20353]
MPVPSQLLFLPGASGSTAFWQPLADQLAHPAARRIVAYPGFGAEPADPDIRDFDGLVQHVLRHIDRPTAVIAQSMGGVIALRAALAKPELVTHLVLTVTSGGLDMQGLGAQDWRTSFVAANPRLPDWFVTFRADLSDELSRIAQPTLLLWGDADPISPVAAGRRLVERLPDARLHVVAGGQHDLAAVHARELAPLVDAHLQRA